MRKLILFTLMLFCSYAYSQSRIDTLLVERKQAIEKVNSLAKDVGLHYADFVHFDLIITKFQNVKKELLSLDDVTNKQMQKILIQPLANEYNEYFILEDDKKGISTLKYGFETREALEHQLKICEATLLNNILGKKLEMIHAKSIAIDKYVNENLKRLNLSRETWDNMSDNDKDILLKKFQD